MIVEELLHSLTAAGFRLSTTDDRILVLPGSRLTDDHRDAIRQHKPALLQLLAPETALPEAVSWRLAAMQANCVGDDGPISFPVAVSGTPAQPGLQTCWSCGAPLARGRTYRCPACVRAVTTRLRGSRGGS